MSRAWWIEYKGALYHLLSRGDERSDIFVDDYDRNSFLDETEEMSERFEIDVFAYVLMGNNYSAVSHTVKSIKAKLKKDPRLRAKFHQINSLFKL